MASVTNWGKEYTRGNAEENHLATVLFAPKDKSLCLWITQDKTGKKMELRLSPSDLPKLIEALGRVKQD